MTYLDAIDRSDNTGSNGNQLPFHPRYLGYARPELVHSPSAAASSWGYADAELRAGSYADGGNLARLRGAVVARLRRHRGGAARARAPDRQRRESDRRGTRDFVDWALPGRSLFVALAFAPVGETMREGAAMFNPVFGQ